MNRAEEPLFKLFKWQSFQQVMEYFPGISHFCCEIGADVYLNVSQLIELLLIVNSLINFDKTHDAY